MFETSNASSQELSDSGDKMLSLETTDTGWDISIDAELYGQVIIEEGEIDSIEPTDFGIEVDSFQCSVETETIEGNVTQVSSEVTYLEQTYSISWSYVNDEAQVLFDEIRIIGPDNEVVYQKI